MFNNILEFEKLHNILIYINIFVIITNKSKIIHVYG